MPPFMLCNHSKTTAPTFIPILKATLNFLTSVEIGKVLPTIKALFSFFGKLISYCENIRSLIKEKDQTDLQSSPRQKPSLEKYRVASGLVPVLTINLQLFGIPFADLGQMCVSSFRRCLKASTSPRRKLNAGVRGMNP